MKATRLSAAALAAVAMTLCASAALADSAPGYTVVDLGRPTGNNVGHIDGISNSGNYAVGKGVVGSNKAYAWDAAAGSTWILATSNTNNWAVGVNDSGVIVGMSSTSAGVSADGTAYSNAATAPVVWKNGSATNLAAAGRVFDINNAGLAVGSSGTLGAVNQRAVIYDTNALSTTTITATTAAGVAMKSASRINNGGLIVGTGVDANGVPVGLLYNSQSGSMTQIAAAASASGAVTVADINNNGVVIGTLGSDNTAQPYSWTASGGLSSVALPTGMTGGTVTGINDQGWIVGYARNSVDANNYAFVDIAGASYLVSSLLGASDLSAWNFSTSSSITLTGIANNGTITGYAENAADGGKIHGFALTVTAPVPEPSSYALMLSGLMAMGAIVRRRGSNKILIA